MSDRDYFKGATVGFMLSALITGSWILFGIGIATLVAWYRSD